MGAQQYEIRPEKEKKLKVWDYEMLGLVDQRPDSGELETGNGGEGRVMQRQRRRWVWGRDKA